MKKLLIVLFLLAAAAMLVVPAQAQMDKFGQGETYSEIIKNDHKQIDSLMSQLKEEEDHGKRDALLKELKDGLGKHMKAEEQYLYPALEKNPSTKGMAVKAKDEHSAAKAELNKVNHMAEKDEYLARLGVLESLIKEHVAFEEGELLGASEGVVDEMKVTEEFKKVYR